MTITISTDYFDSLVDWASVYDIIDVYPHLTMQQARLVHNFHAVEDIGMKAAMLFNIISSMIKHSELSDSQITFISELVNFDDRVRAELIAAFNHVSKVKGSDLLLQVGGEHLNSANLLGL